MGGGAQGLFYCQPYLGFAAVDKAAFQRARRRCSVFALEKRDPRALRDADALDIEVELFSQLVEGEVSVGNVLDIQTTAVARRIGPC